MSSATFYTNTPVAEAHHKELAEEILTSRIFHVMLSPMEVQSEKNWQHLKGPESSKHRKMILAMEAFSFASVESHSDWVQ
jgi:hypothetical protein